MDNTKGDNYKTRWVGEEVGRIQKKEWKKENGREQQDESEKRVSKGEGA